MSVYPANSSLPAQANLVSRWRLDESSDGSAAVTRSDMIATNHLTDSNTTPSATGYSNVNGVNFVNAANFERTNTEYLSIADASQAGLDITGSLTIAAWVKFTTQNNDHAIAAKWQESGGQRSYLLHGPGSSPFGLNVSTDGTTNAGKFDFWNGSTTPSNGIWYHVVGVYISGTGAKIYLNGVDDLATQAATSTVQTTIFNSTSAFSLGIQSIGSNFELLDGLENDVIVWNTALTATQVSNLYALYQASTANAALLSALAF